MVVLCFHRLWHPVLTLATPWETWHEQVGVTWVFTVFGKRMVMDPGEMPMSEGSTTNCI
tara:strand:+ start:716 stop:892 length:177 start_codon:yes stop_codon:yes gene_type:complete